VRQVLLRQQRDAAAAEAEVLVIIARPDPLPAVADLIMHGQKRGPAFRRRQVAVAWRRYGRGIRSRPVVFLELRPSQAANHVSAAPNNFTTHFHASGWLLITDPHLPFGRRGWSGPLGCGNAVLSQELAPLGHPVGLRSELLLEVGLVVVPAFPRGLSM